MKLRFEELRKEYNYSKKEIAEYLGCSIKTYSNYESGEHRVPTRVLIKIADFYNISIDYILYLTDEKERQ